MIIEITFPILTTSEANSREHWAKSAHRHRNQKQITYLELESNQIPDNLPVIITLTRLSPRKLDIDNLPPSLKYIKDAVAEYFVPGLAPGRADDDKGFTWLFAQPNALWGD